MDREINFAVDNGNLDLAYIHLVFEDEPYVVVPHDADMLDLLVRGKFFSSKGDARRNGWAGREKIPEGLSDYTIGKLRRRMWVFNPRPLTPGDKYDE